MLENMQTLVKYATHICSIFFCVFPAYATVSGEES